MPPCLPTGLADIAPPGTCHGPQPSSGPGWPALRSTGTTPPEVRRTVRSVDESVSAPELARRLGVRAVTFRAWLRRQWRAGHPLLQGHDLNGRYRFSFETARQLAAQYRVSQRD